MTILKSKLFFLVIFCSLLLMQGCIPSLHPLYSDNTLIKIDEIIGTWGDSDNEGDNKLMITTNSEDGLPNTWSFEKEGEKSYRLIQIDEDGRKAAFEAHFVKLGDDVFVDFFPAHLNKSDGVFSTEAYPSVEKMNSLLALHTMPVHTFAKVEVTDEHFKIKMFNYDWISDLFEQNRIRLKHELTDSDNILLTASTAELQKFVIKYADEPEAYVEETSLTRKF